ncbi:hypothetical protein ACOSP7_023101 [Xanthoceras sorbifolium]
MMIIFIWPYSNTNDNLMSPPAAPSVAVGESLPPPPPRHADDFRPTAPGHSPGVGHSLQN